MKLRSLLLVLLATLSLAPALALARDAAAPNEASSVVGRGWSVVGGRWSVVGASQNVADPNDPLFPQPIPTSSTGKGPKRWKLGAVIAWLRACEVAAHNS